MTIEELREKFESSAKSAFFKLDRNEHGEYSSAATFNLWAGYWMAARDSEQIIGDEANWNNAHK